VRTFNFDHLMLPGASQLHPHQKAGAWRILQTPTTLLARMKKWGLKKPAV
jgi:N12 class adenine-specific DNA methylase